MVERIRLRMENKVYVDNNGILIHKYIGDQDGPDIDRIYSQSEELISTLPKPINMLADVSKLGHHTSLARKRGGYYLTNFPIRKMAVIGSSPVFKYVAPLMIAAVNVGKKVRLFSDEESARKWLNE